MVTYIPQYWIKYNDDTSTLNWPALWYNTYESTNTYVNTATYGSGITYNTTPKFVEPSKFDRRKIIKSKLRTIRIKNRAEELLLSNLTPEQREMYLKLKKFHIIGSDGQRYELDATKKWHNVYRLNAEGKRVEEYCLYQSGDTPISDNHLMQKLIVEADTELLKRVANRRAM